ncbi:MAG TPA: carboxypeptidase-like regulatory domain-containing protein [Bryobacteraceae bacterium]|nr:carboxypeptidase-like regulatory domain-containing protein [Bryobacteraceae bacterium]
MAVKSLLLMALAGLVLAGRVFAQPAGRGVISGTVVDSASGDPVRKAIVTVTWQGTPRSWATAATDGSGNFRFEGLPAGKYDLRARKAGVGEAAYGAKSARELGELITLGGGETLSGLELRILHSASISGRVFDPEGDPVVGANVALLRPGRSLGARILANYIQTSTDDRGEYRFAGIDPGEYYARAMPVRPGQSRVEEGTREIATGVFYGGARQSKDASPLTIRGGENLAGIDFRLIAEQTAQVHGHISGAPAVAKNNEEDRLYQAPQNFIQVQVMSLEEDLPAENFGTTIQASDSSFSLPDIPAGRYRVRAVMQTANKAFGAAQVLDLHPGENEIELTLTPAIEIKGQVRFEGPTAPPAARMRVALTQPGVRGENVSAALGSDGRFTLAQVFPGEWEIDVNGMPRGTFLKSARLGDKDILFSPFEIESGDAPINIVASTNTAAIEGQVDAGAADRARAGIVLAPSGKLHDFARFYYSVAAGDDGKFQLNGIAPGKYTIFALEKMAPAGFRNPEAADQLAPLGQEIELTEGKTIEVHPKLIPQERAREAIP